MNAPQIIRTPGGEELVLMSRIDYDTLMARLADMEEDAADVAAYDEAKAKLACGEDRILSAEESRAVLGRGAVVRALRKSKGMSQSDLARASDVSQAFLSKVERGEVGFSRVTREKIAAVLSVSPADLG